MKFYSGLIKGAEQFSYLKIMANPHILAFAVILGLKMVTSSPVYPILSLDQFDPVDACLFICNICYEDFRLPNPDDLYRRSRIAAQQRDSANAEIKENPDGSQMMKCANNICMSGKYSFNLGMLEIGRNCKHFDKIQKYIFGSGNKIE